MSIVIYHNPDCGTSRNVLATIRASGQEPTVVEYLKTGWTRPQLLSLFAAAGLTPRTALRTSKSPAEELGLLDPSVSDDALLDAMLEHPILVNRPIVCTSRGVRLCRPSETVLSLLDRPPLAAVIKEDGDVISEGHDLPALDADSFNAIDENALFAPSRAPHRPRILLLYGSLRERSFSRFMAEEAARVLELLGAETRLFDPTDLPLPDGAPADHPRVAALRDAVTWSEGMVWSSPERHGAMSAILKAQIDWIPLSLGGVRPTQGKTLAVMQVCGGSQSFNAVNQMRILGRWMRLITIPNQSSVSRAWQEFDEAGRMRASPFYDRMVDVMEELVKFTLLTRDRSAYLTDRYSERHESRAELSARVNQTAI